MCLHDQVILTEVLPPHFLTLPPADLRPRPQLQPPPPPPPPQTLLPTSSLTTMLAYATLTLIGSPTLMPLLSSVKKSSPETFTSFVIAALLQF
jgi:hypothetical protein